mgnify:CR=1 FL=1
MMNQTYAPRARSAEQMRERARLARIRMEQARRQSRRMLCVFSVLLVAALFVYISRMATISAAGKQISQLKRDISALTSDKQYREISLTARQNLERVQYEALNRLGMVYPGEGQIQMVRLSGENAGDGVMTVYDTNAKDGQ